MRELALLGGGERPEEKTDGKIYEGRWLMGNNIPPDVNIASAVINK